jgi:hypothetical protein
VPIFAAVVHPPSRQRSTWIELIPTQLATVLLGWGIQITVLIFYGVNLSGLKIRNGLGSGHVGFRADSPHGGFVFVSVAHYWGLVAHTGDYLDSPASGQGSIPDAANRPRDALAGIVAGLGKPFCIHM